MMKKTIRENTHAAYSLHDMNILSVDVVGNDIILRTQSGLVETEFPYGQPDGYVEFHNVRWNYSYAYILAFSGNSGTFSGEKLFLKDFLSANPTLGFTVMDETYGYNCTKYSGYITINGKFHECFLEIYHEGDMVFVAEKF